MLKDDKNIFGLVSVPNYPSTWILNDVIFPYLEISWQDIFSFKLSNIVDYRFFFIFQLKNSAFQCFIKWKIWKTLSRFFKIFFLSKQFIHPIYLLKVAFASEFCKRNWIAKISKMCVYCFLHFALNFLCKFEFWSTTLKDDVKLME